jgi:hypothetical protein
MVVHDPADQVTCQCPLQPPHKFPRLDLSRCQKILCPHNGNSTLASSELIDMTSQSSPTVSTTTKLSSDTPQGIQLTSQPWSSSVRPADCGSPPQDVGS